MGYRDVMSTSAPPADRRNEDSIELRRLVEEQAALRRVATLVASGAPSAEVFSAVAREIAQVMHLPAVGVFRYDSDGMMTVIATWSDRPYVFQPGTRWPLDGQTMVAQVQQTGRPARVEDYTNLPGALAARARESGLNATAGAPIIVNGSVWGAVGAASPDAPLPDHVEDRLAQFTELVATAIANGQAQEELTRLAEEQAALRRVATLVASGATAGDVFDAVAQEVAQVLRLTNAAVCRYDQDGSTMTVLAVHGPRPDTFRPGSRWPLDGRSMSAEVLRTGRPVRIEEYADVPGSLAAAAREHGFSRVAGAPIIVNGAVWGVISTSSSPTAPLPEHAEDRLAEFTELVATAIANSQADEERTRLAEEQAALRRVATLVAAGSPPAEVFEAVSAEVAALIAADGSALTRYEADGTVTAVSGWTTEGGYIYVGRRYELEGTVSGLIFETGRPGRVDNYAEAPGEAPEAAREMGWRSSVGAPITVDGRLWGVLAVVSKSETPLPPDTERRLAEFAELFATAIANSEAHEQLAQLADEQAALRRVATLVAEGATPHRVFDAVRREVARMFNTPLSVLLRYDANGTATVLATSDGYLGPIGRSWPVEGDSSAIARVCRTGLPARVDYARPAPGPIAAAARALHVRSAVGVPIVVDGTLWGVMAVGSRETEALPADFEGRLAKFTELLATAVANAEGRAELDASRARIVATADATRRRIERDLHDGAQQQLVSLALAVRAAQATVPEELEQHRSELGRVVDGLTDALDDLREIALGIHPAGLSEDGLTPALKRLVARSPLRVNLDCRADGRFPEPVEVTTYYVVSESLTNAAKYAETPVVDVAVAAEGGALRVEVRDDGRGGADPAEGSGLLGLRDRVEAIGGTMRLSSPPGAGTALRVELPLVDQAARR
jgi:signal transduction histidine kinase